MIERVNINAPPSYPKPKYKSTPSVEAQTYEALILILIELQKINKHLDKLLEEKPVKVDLVEYNLRPPFTIT